VNSSPVIFGNKVVTGSSDGRLYILNLDDGAKLWSYETGGEVSGFAVTGGMIIAGVGDARVYAFKQSSRRTTDYPPSP
jgi:outer membrane protein assembly factor BamB